MYIIRSAGRIPNFFAGRSGGRGGFMGSGRSPFGSFTLGRGNNVWRRETAASEAPASEEAQKSANEPGAEANLQEKYSYCRGTAVNASGRGLGRGRGYRGRGRGRLDAPVNKTWVKGPDMSSALMTER